MTRKTPATGSETVESDPASVRPDEAGVSSAAQEAKEIEQVRVRRAKLAALREQAGAFPKDWTPDTSAGRLVAEFGAMEGEAVEAATGTYSLGGRVMAIRSFGKSTFLGLQDGSGTIQLFASKGDLGEAYAGVKKLDVGDIVGARGTLFRTRTGELTLRCDELRLMVKSLRPLPEKWHGLQDKETRYRQRYVDLIVNAEVRETFRRRATVTATVREFLGERGYLEVETPMMQPIVGGATARPFVTHHNALSMDLYLRVAPELYLKRLVVGGLERVFELNRNFRNEGLSRQHNPEFTMLEFYQAWATYEDLMALTEEMLGEIARRVTGGTRVVFEGTELDFSPPFRRLPMAEAVAAKAGIPVADATDVAALTALADRMGIAREGRQEGLGILADVFEHLCEADLVQPTFVTGFPAEVSPLARRSDADPRFVDRFEMYAAGREIANGFSELNDPEDQRERFLVQVRRREAGDAEAQMLDEDYVRALEYGLPPTAGEGIGIDRLTMLLTDSASIRDVILFPHLRPED